jgi:hypothetical protein
MPLWSLNRPPLWLKKIGKKIPIFTIMGWVQPETREVLVTMNNRLSDAGPADVVDVRFTANSYNQGDPLTVIVHFNEAVDVVSGATIELSWSGISGNFFCSSGNQTNVHEVIFSGTIPNESGSLEISSGAFISGAITDTGTLVPANLIIPSYLDPYFKPIVIL